MILTEIIIEASMKCIARSMPFAVSLQPGATEARFYASDNVMNLSGGNLPQDWQGFLISSFGLNDGQAPEGIAADYTVSDILAMSTTDTDVSRNDVESLCMSDYPNLQSTDYSEYEKNIVRVTSALTGKDGKTVISRLEMIESDASPFDVTERYFTMFPSCYRAIYYTRAKGMWIVATPETLMEYDQSRHTLHTMSLAGTRRIGEGTWDLKNVREHELVTEYITHTLRDAGMDVTVDASENLPFGSIEHLCNRISATGDVSPLELAMRLSPTPAVCGWPVMESYKTICRLERHSRGCYGGFVGTADENGVRLYVNLRCCRILTEDDDTFTYCLFAGGGINSMSDPHDEWNEATHKMAPLISIITNKDNTK